VLDVDLGNVMDITFVAWWAGGDEMFYCWVSIPPLNLPSSLHALARVSFLTGHKMDWKKNMNYLTCMQSCPFPVHMSASLARGPRWHPEFVLNFL
jgi:hypothetical protein